MLWCGWRGGEGGRRRSDLDANHICANMSALAMRMMVNMSALAMMMVMTMMTNHIGALP